MATDIRAALRDEAMRFADRVHDLMLSQLASALGAPATPPKAPKVPGTRQRLSQESIEEALAQIVKLLEKSPTGLRSEQIRADLNMDKKLFQYAANLGRTSDQLTQSGERRLTVYSLPKRPSRAQEEGRVIKKGNKK